MKWLRTAVNDVEHKALLDFCQENNMSIYGLLKTAIFEYVESHSGRSLRNPLGWRPPQDTKIGEILDQFKDRGIDVTSILKDALHDHLKESDRPRKKV